MSVEAIKLSDCIPGLEQSVVPAWVMLPEPVEFVWANDAALGLWRASSREELFARDMISKAPAKVVARTRDVVARVLAGNIVREEWTFYPRGEPELVLLDLRAVRLDDGRLAVLNQATTITEAVPAAVQRAVAVFRHSAVISAFVDGHGVIVSQNPAALLLFGETRSWLRWFADPSRAEAMLAEALTGEAVRAEVPVLAQGQPRWHVVEVQSLRDPITGELGVLVEHHDETARVEAERLAQSRGEHIDELSETLALVEAQRREILALSAPILEVGGGTLAVPIIGSFDEQKGEELEGRLLEAVSARGVREVIFDLTGVAEVEEQTAARLRQLVSAIRLLGARPRITGVCARLAVELLDAGFDLDAIPTSRSLAEGLGRAHRRR